MKLEDEDLREVRTEGGEGGGLQVPVGEARRHQTGRIKSWDVYRPLNATPVHCGSSPPLGRPPADRSGGGVSGPSHAADHVWQPRAISSRGLWAKLEWAIPPVRGGGGELDVWRSHSALHLALPPGVHPSLLAPLLLTPPPLSLSLYTSISFTFSLLTFQPLYLYFFDICIHTNPFISILLSLNTSLYVIKATLYYLYKIHLPVRIFTWTQQGLQVTWDLLVF